MISFENLNLTAHFVHLDDHYSMRAANGHFSKCVYPKKSDCDNGYCLKRKFTNGNLVFHNLHALTGTDHLDLEIFAELSVHRCDLMLVKMDTLTKEEIKDMIENPSKYQLVPSTKEDPLILLRNCTTVDDLTYEIKLSFTKERNELHLKEFELNIPKAFGDSYYWRTRALLEQFGLQKMKCR
jgi:hypothetical protein